RLFVRTYVRMLTDVRGRLWIDDPLLVFGLLSLLWVLVAYLHTAPWSGGKRHFGELRQRLLDGFSGVRVVLQRSRQIRVVRPHIKVAMARQVEQNDATLASLARPQRFIDGRSNRVRRLGCWHDTFGSGELHCGFEDA